VSNRRTLMAAAAIVLAAVAGIGVYVYASNADSRAQENAQFVDTYVASSDIAKGTTGEEAVQAGLIAKEKVARSSVPASVIVSENDLADKVAASRIDSKQFITAQSFVSAAEGVGGQFAQAIAAPNLVAVTVNMDVERGVANQIEPGDHVDIAQTLAGIEGAQSTTSYLLQNVKVLAVGVATVAQQAVVPTADAAAAATPVVQSGLLTFEVTSDQALLVIQANTGQGKPYLVLLPPKLGSSSGGTAAPASGTR
jgi:Flp pilus assembly protein CpaB